MPKKVKKKLKKQCRKKGWSTRSEKCKRYIYGTLNKIEKDKK